MKKLLGKTEEKPYGGWSPLYVRGLKLQKSKHNQKDSQSGWRAKKITLNLHILP